VRFTIKRNRILVAKESIREIAIQDIILEQTKNGPCLPPLCHEKQSSFLVPCLDSKVRPGIGF
jgi:hypothetical protein